jgi:hypothetical protein
MPRASLALAAPRRALAPLAALLLLTRGALSLHGFDDSDDDSGRSCAKLPGAVGCNAGRCPCDDGSNLPLYACSTTTSRGAQRDAAGDAIGECVQSPSFYALVSAGPAAAALLLCCCWCYCCRAPRAAKGAAAAAAARGPGAAGGSADVDGASLVPYCTQCGRAFGGGADERFCTACGAQRARVVGDPVAAEEEHLPLPPPGYAAEERFAAEPNGVSDWHGVVAVGRASAP